MLESITLEKGMQICVGHIFVPYIIGRGMEYLNNMNEKTTERGALFLGWCNMHRLTISNAASSRTHRTD